MLIADLSNRNISPYASAVKAKEKHKTFASVPGTARRGRCALSRRDTAFGTVFAVQDNHIF